MWYTRGSTRACEQVRGGIAMQAQDQPIEIQATPAGQVTPVPAMLPPGRQRFAWVGQLLRNRKAALGGGIVLFFILIAIFAPVVAPGDPTEVVARPPPRPARRGRAR